MLDVSVGLSSNSGSVNMFNDEDTVSTKLGRLEACPRTEKNLRAMPENQGGKDFEDLI